MVTQTLEMRLENSTMDKTTMGDPPLPKKGKLKKPNIKSRGNSQAAPKGGGPKGDGKGGGKASGWCHAHLRPGGCPHGKDCMFPHHDEAAVEEIKRAAAKKKAKRDPSKGKGQQK